MATRRGSTRAGRQREAGAAGLGAGGHAVQRIVSGGQTGVDRAALDVALALGLECGGWCPSGRWAEDGAIPARYPLRETPSDAPEQRTEWNVRDSDATLVLTLGRPTGGTALTLRVAERLGKPARVVDPTREPPGDTRAWAEALGVRALNVAGPRESEAPGAYALARPWLEALLAGG